MSCTVNKPFSTSFLGFPSAVAVFVLGVDGGFNDKSLIDGKLSRFASLSDIVGAASICLSQRIQFRCVVYVNQRAGNLRNRRK